MATLQSRIQNITSFLTANKNLLRTSIINKGTSVTPPENPTFQQLIDGVNGISAGTTIQALLWRFQNQGGSQSGSVYYVPFRYKLVCNFNQNVTQNSDLSGMKTSFTLNQNKHLYSSSPTFTGTIKVQR